MTPDPPQPSSQPPPAPGSPSRALRIVWISFLLTQVLYFLAAAGGVVGREAGDLPQRFPWLPLVFAAAAIPCALLAHVVRRRTLAEEGTPRLSGFIFSWGLIEAVAVLGLLLAVLGYGSSAWAPLLGVATGLMFLHAPPRGSGAS